MAGQFTTSCRDRTALGSGRRRIATQHAENRMNIRCQHRRTTMKYQRSIAEIEAYVSPWAREYVATAAAGNPDAAETLACVAQNAARGVLAVDFWRLRVERPAFRRLLHAVWEHDHRHLIRAAESRRRLRAMFSYADFQVPDHLPGLVTVWRGTSALPYSRARRGLAWSLRREVACWFAMRFAERNGSPLVLRGTVPRSTIALYTDERSESEAVLFDVAGVEIDGSPDDWCEGHRVYQQELAKVVGGRARAPARRDMRE